MRREVKVEVYGAGCNKFFQTVNSLKKAVKKSNIAGEVQEITNDKKIAACGIVNMTAVFINGRLLSQGEGITVEKAGEFFRTIA